MAKKKNRNVYRPGDTKKADGNQQEKKLKIKLSYIISAAIILVLLVGGIVGYNWYGKIDKAAITVDGEVITQKELSRVMKDLETKVIEYFKTNYNVSPSDEGVGVNYWFSKYGDQKENPLDYLKNLASDEAVKIKLQQMDFVKYGLKKESDIQYKTFLQLYQKEYARRQDPNEKVAGVRTIRETNYFNELFEKDVESLREKLVADKTLVVSVDEVKERYKEQLSKLKLKDYLKVEGVFARLTDTQVVPTDEDREEMVTLLAAIRTKLVKGQDPEKVCEAASQENEGKYTFTYSEVEIDDEMRGRDSEISAEYDYVTEGMEIGVWAEAKDYGKVESTGTDANSEGTADGSEEDTGYVEEEEGAPNIGPALIKLLERTDQGYVLFDDIRPKFEDDIAKVKYKEYYADLLGTYRNEGKIKKNASAIKQTKLRSDGSY